MITPRFSLSQDAMHVIITVHVPYVRVGEAEAVVDGCNVSVYCKPYFLQLVLPGEVLDDERSHTTYDADLEHGTMTLRFPKQQPGEVFADLDLVTKLLAPRMSLGAAIAHRPTSGALDLRHIKKEDDSTNEPSEVATGLASLSLDRSARVAPLFAPPSGRPGIEVLSSFDFADDNLPSGSPSPCVTESPLLVHASADAANTESTNETAGTTCSSLETSTRYSAAADVPLQSSSRPSSLLLNPITASEDSQASHLLQSPSSLLQTAATYGFGRRFSNFFAALRAEFPDLVRLPSPDSTPPTLRRELRLKTEATDWSPSRYCDDLEASDDPIYTDAMMADSWKPWWIKQAVSSRIAAPLSGILTSEEVVLWDWSPEERDALASLPNREYLLDGTLSIRSSSSSSSCCNRGASSQPGDSVGVLGDLIDVSRPESTRALCSLISIVAAYCYDVRTTANEPTCESGWTIAILSPVLSWLDDEFSACGVETPLSSAEENPANAAAVFITPATAVVLTTPVTAAAAAAATAVVISHSHVVSRGESAACALLRDASAGFLRRALIYPYLRRWDLGLTCLSDAASIFSLGRRGILRTLLGVRSRLSAAEPGYLLNTLFIDDFCVWIQCGPRDDDLRTIGAALRSISILDDEAALGGAFPSLPSPLRKSDPEFADLGLEAAEEEAFLRRSDGDDGEVAATSAVDDSDGSDEEEEEDGDTSDSDSERDETSDNGEDGDANDDEDDQEGSSK